MEGYKSSPTLRVDLVRKLLHTWKKYPTLRFGQLISCVVKDKDLFAVHDEQFLSMLEAFDNEHTTTTR
jgi:hypothetical protein